jgi:hypothetical protein
MTIAVTNAIPNASSMNPQRYRSEPQRRLNQETLSCNSNYLYLCHVTRDIYSHGGHIVMNYPVFIYIALSQVFYLSFQRN